jgi:uncharacterized protein YjbI with pentapeptide repeats
VNFTGADLALADLVGSDLSGATFRNANLAGAKLGGTNLTGADFRGANLTGVKFMTALIRKADFTGAEMDGVDFSGADLTDADFGGKNFRCFWDDSTIFGNGLTKSGSSESEPLKWWTGERIGFTEEMGWDINPLA